MQPASSHTLFEYVRDSGYGDLARIGAWCVVGWREAPACRISSFPAGASIDRSGERGSEGDGARTTHSDILSCLVLWRLPRVSVEPRPSKDSSSALVATGNTDRPKRHRLRPCDPG